MLSLLVVLSLWLGTIFYSRITFLEQIQCSYLIGSFHGFFQYTSIKPLGDRVLVKIKSLEEKTSGGILLPTTAQSKPQGGEVVAVGEGRTIGPKQIDISVQVWFPLDILDS